jgi:hypothetical protein
MRRAPSKLGLRLDKVLGVRGMEAVEKDIPGLRDGDLGRQDLLESPFAVGAVSSHSMPPIAAADWLVG